MYTLWSEFRVLSIKSVFEENYTFSDEEPTELPPEFIVFLDLFGFLLFQYSSLTFTIFFTFHNLLLYKSHLIHLLSSSFIFFHPHLFDLLKKVYGSLGNINK